MRADQTGLRGQGGLDLGIVRRRFDVQVVALVQVIGGEIAVVVAHARNLRVQRRRGRRARGRGHGARMPVAPAGLRRQAGRHLVYPQAGLCEITRPQRRTDAPFLNLAIARILRQQREGGDRAGRAAVGGAQCGGPQQARAQRRQQVRALQQQWQQVRRGVAVGEGEAAEAGDQRIGLDRCRRRGRQRRKRRLRRLEQLYPLEQGRGARRRHVDHEVAGQPRVVGRQRRSRAILREFGRDQSLGAQPRKDAVAVVGLALRQYPARERVSSESVGVAGGEPAGQPLADELCIRDIRRSRHEPVPALALRQADQPVVSQRAGDELPGMRLDEGVDRVVEVVAGSGGEIAAQTRCHQVIMDHVAGEHRRIGRFRQVQADALHGCDEFQLDRRQRGCRRSGCGRCSRRGVGLGAGGRRVPDRQQHRQGRQHRPGERPQALSCLHRSILGAAQASVSLW